MAKPGSGDQQEIILRKTPFLFLKWLVAIEFFFRRFVDVSFPEIDGKEVCAVSVSPSTQPAYLQAKGQEKFYIRAGNASQPLTVSQATRYILERFGS